MLKEVEDFPGYFVHSDGYVVGKRGRILKGKITWDGYREIVMSDGDRRRSVRVHRLVAHYFIGPCPEGFVVDHIDDDKLHNKSSNLQYITNTENIQKASRNGQIKCRGKSYCSLTKEDFETMLNMYLNGKSYTEIKNHFGLQCRSDYIGEILRGRKLSTLSGFTSDMRKLRRSETIT